MYKKGLHPQPVFLIAGAKVWTFFRLDIMFKTHFP